VSKEIFLFEFLFIKMKSPQNKDKRPAPPPKETKNRFVFLSKYFQNPFFSSRLFEVLLFVLILGIALLGGMLFLHADPPRISWSQDVATDPPQYTYFARNHVLWGSWDLFGHNRFIFFLKSFTTLFSYLVFWLFGTGRFQANLAAVILNLLSMTLLYFALKKVFNKRAAFFTLFFLGINYIFIMYGRNPFLEISAIFLIILGFFLMVYSFQRDKLLILSGACMAGGIFFGKTMAAFILGPCLGVLLLWMFENYSPADRKLNFKPPLYFGMGFSAIALFWLFFSYLPAKKEIAGYLGEQALGLYGFPTAFQSVAGFANALFSFGLETRVEFNIFLLMPVLFLLSFLGIIWFFTKRSSLKELIRYRDDRAKSEFFLAFWFLVGFFVVMALNYRPLRYDLYLIPPMCALAGLGLDSFLSLSGSKKVFKPGILFWFFFVISVTFFTNYAIITGYTLITAKEIQLILSLGISLLITLGAALVLYFGYIRPKADPHPKTADTGKKMGLKWAAALILLFLSLGINLAQFTSWASSPKYSLNRASIDLGRILNREAVLSGPYGPALVWDDQLKDIIHMFGVTKADPQLFLTYPITHLALERGGNRERALQDYPEVMKKAQIVATYWIRNLPVDIYRIAEYTGNPQTQKYQLSDFEKGKVLLLEGKKDSALVIFEKFVDRQPDNFSGYQNLAEIYFQAGDFNKTEAALKKAIQFHPTDFFVYQQMGMVYLALWDKTRQGTYKAKTITAWEKSVELCPENTKLAAQLRELRGF
jgi:tetratricopeptide (TPR) repeat protein